MLAPPLVWPWTLVLRSTGKDCKWNTFRTCNIERRSHRVAWWLERVWRAVCTIHADLKTRIKTAGADPRRASYAVGLVIELRPTNLLIIGRQVRPRWRLRRLFGAHTSRKCDRGELHNLAKRCDESLSHQSLSC